MDASAMSAARAVNRAAISALTVAALLTVALAASACFQPGTWPLPKKAHASPAGTSHPQAIGRIAFASNKDGNHEIYAMNADGSGVDRLTRDRGGDYSPSWSPDGSRIAFMSNREDFDYQIYAMNADGSGVTRLTNNRFNDYYPSWSPDGSRIAFASIRNGNWEIYAMNADGSGVTRLTNNSADDNFPSWSPDGRRIAFTSNRDGNWDIYAMNADGSGAARLTDNSDDDRRLRDPSWSPDGRRIVFVSGRDGNWEIYAMNADGSGASNLTNNSANEWGASWSPDGRRVAFVSDRDGRGEIYAMNADGAGAARISDNFSATIQDLSWGPLTQAGKAALTATAVVKAEARAAATPTPTRVPCPPGKPCVSLHSDKTTVDIGEPIKLTLAAVNDITLPALTIQMVIEVPNGWSVKSSEMTEACTAALCSITFNDLPAGLNRSASIEIFPNETGDFLAHATLKWFNGEATEENIEWREKNISVKVNPKPTPEQAAVTPPAATPIRKRFPPPPLPPCVPAPCNGCPPRSGASAAADAGWLLAGLALPGLAFSGRLRKRPPLTPPNRPSTPADCRPGRGRRG